METTPPEREVWADERVVVDRSGIHGRGLVATEDIAAGHVVVRLGGRLVGSADLAELIDAAETDPDGTYVDSITVYEGAHLVMPPGSVAHFVNHSCAPTLWHVGPYELAARRQLSAGDELTVDYGTNSGAEEFVMTCRCRATDCRGRVTSDDWRRPELQLRYEGHWTPALQRRIERASPAQG